MIFSDLIFLKTLFSLAGVDGPSIPYLDAKVTILLPPSSYLLLLGSLEFKYLRTFGHLIVSIMFTSPPLTYSNSAARLWNMLLSSSSLADGLIYSSTVKHLLTNILSFEEYFWDISVYYPLVIFLYREGKSVALKGTLRVQSSYVRHPRDHISHLLPYFYPDHI